MRESSCSTRRLLPSRKNRAHSGRRSLMSGLVDAGHSVALLAKMPEAGHGPIADEKSRDAFEPQSVREHDVDRQAVRKDDDTLVGRFVCDCCGEGGENARAEGDRIASEIGDWIADEA